MDAVVITYDGRGAARFINSAAALSGPELRRASVRAVNHIGNKAYTAVKRALVGQTGIRYSDVDRAVYPRRAWAGFGDGAIEFHIVGSGDEIPLKYFGAKQQRHGVWAKPWNRPQVFIGAFTTGGRFPNRKPVLGGNVFVRTGSSRLPIRMLYGPAIGKEIVKDEAKAAFERTSVELQPRLAHEIGRLMP